MNVSAEDKQMQIQHLANQIVFFIVPIGSLGSKQSAKPVVGPQLLA